jgi:hypothetical protein
MAMDHLFVAPLQIEDGAVEATTWLGSVEDVRLSAANAENCFCAI